MHNILIYRLSMGDAAICIRLPAADSAEFHVAAPWHKDITEWFTQLGSYVRYNDVNMLYSVQQCLMLHCNKCNLRWECLQFLPIHLPEHCRDIRVAMQGLVFISNRFSGHVEVK